MHSNFVLVKFCKRNAFEVEWCCRTEIFAQPIAHRHLYQRCAHGVSPEIEASEVDVALVNDTFQGLNQVPEADAVLADTL